MAKLTARFVETTSKTGRHVDGAGLCLLVAPNGSKKWVLRYQINGRRRDMGLGPYPEVSLAMARERAADARRLAFAGGDPIEQRRAQREAKPIPTFKEVAAEVIALEQAKSNNEKVRYQWVLLLGPSYCGSLLERRVNEVTTGDVERVLRPVWHSKPETARKLHHRLRRVFEHARIRLRDVHGLAMPDNPARWDDLKALGFEAPKKLSRGPQPSLAYQQMPSFMADIRRRAAMAARALELLILTAVRTDAVRRAQWKEFDLEAALWTIPVEHLKDKRTRSEPFRVPLAPSAVVMLRELEEKRTSDFLFPGPSGRKPISNMAIIALLRKANVGEDGAPRWRDPRDGRPIVPHGFRATFRTWAEDQTHYPNTVIEQAMGHQVGTEVERAYRRTDVLEKRRALMIDWATYLKTSEAAPQVSRSTSPKQADHRRQDLLKQRREVMKAV